MLACTLVHRKFLGRTPHGKAVFRAFLGGAGSEALLAETDETLVAARAARNGCDILGTKFSLRTLSRSMFRFALATGDGPVCRGPPERMQRIAERVATLPGLRLAGNAYDGIGIPDCIRLGRQAARDLVAAGVDSPSGVSA